MDLQELGAKLRAEARETDQRRLVVLAGNRHRGYEALETLLDGAGTDWSQTTILGADGRNRDGIPHGLDTVGMSRAKTLLGTTREAVALDLHEEFRPNAIGATAGAVDGGGLYVLLTPPLEAWPERRDAFDERMAAPPFSVADVSGRFRRRFVATLRRGRGIALLDVDEERVLRTGLTDPAPRIERDGAADVPSSSGDRTFPAAAYDRCRTDDQRRALLELEALCDPSSAVVVEADRGRGKSSVAGLAAGSLAAAGEDVLVTAPEYRNAREVLLRSAEVLTDLDQLDPAQGPRRSPRELDGTGGGRVRFRPPEEAIEAVTRPHGDTPDVVLVDEAAALPVRRLEALLDADRILFATTTYGYEGTGRGFTVRFRDRLETRSHDLHDVRLDEPIRYAAGDPVETWAFDALLLNATPVPDDAIESATPESVQYSRLDPDELLEDEHRLREAFGLLVLAHYRTEPADLVRLLDAPNLAIRALLHDGHVAAVALLAREGGLSRETRSGAFDGDRIRGNMLPDVLMSQLRDRRAGRPVGARVVRIATHPAVRNRGLGSTLLGRIRAEAESGLPEWTDAPTPAGADDPGSGALDWVGVGYGTTPQLVRFWSDNGYGTIHLSTTRNDRSGEYSVLMVDPITDRGEALYDRTARRFARRIGGVCSGPLSDADPDVVRAALAAVDERAVPELSLTEWEWTVVASAAYGPGMADVAPEPFRRLAVCWLIERGDRTNREANRQRLLVRKALQGQPWDSAASDLEYPSAGACMRAFGDAFEPIVDEYGTEHAHTIRDRYTGSNGGSGGETSDHE